MLLNASFIIIDLKFYHFSQLLSPIRFVRYRARSGGAGIGYRRGDEGFFFFISYYKPSHKMMFTSRRSGVTRGKTECLYASSYHWSEFDKKKEATFSYFSLHHTSNPVLAVAGDSPNRSRWSFALFCFLSRSVIVIFVRLNLVFRFQLENLII